VQGGTGKSKRSQRKPSPADAGEPQRLVIDFTGAQKAPANAGGQRWQAVSSGGIGKLFVHGLFQ
jgi:hypothetical protein